MNLIIRTSQSLLPNSTILKSNLGDLLRTTIVVENMQSDFLWLTDTLGKKILSYFLDESLLVTFDDIKEFHFNAIYNFDNYITNLKVFRKLKGEWNGFVFYKDSITPANEVINDIIAYSDSKSSISWQEALITALGFKWEEQDYAQTFLKTSIKYQVGFNYDVHADWHTKRWPKEYWKELEKELKYHGITFSWQEGLDDLDTYFQWINSCKVIVSCDSFGMHLASALRKDVILLTGPTESKEYFYNRLYKLYPSLELNCLPCSKPICSNDKHMPTCLNSVQVNDVLNLIKKILLKGIK